MNNHQSSVMVTVAFIMFATLIGWPVPLAAQPVCTFSTGFQALHDAIPEVVGDCTGAEATNPATGNVEQPTTNGRLILRSGDGLTGFTNGQTLWLAGPDGIVSRAIQEPPFGWEGTALASPGSVQATPVLASPQTTPDATPTAATPQVGPPRVGRIYFSTNPDPAKRAETDQSVFKSGIQIVYTYFDYYDVTPPNNLKSYMLQNNSSDNFTNTGGSFIPPQPTGVGRRTLGNTAGRGISEGKFTLVVELNGQEVARRDFLIQ